MNKSASQTSISMLTPRAEEPSAVADAELVARAQKGDMTAYEELVHRYRGKIYALAYNVVNNTEDANDIAQMAFVKAWKSLGNFRGQSAFYTWMYRITMNLGLDWKARLSNRPTLELDEKIGLEEKESVDYVSNKAERPSANLERAERSAAVHAALEKLSAEHRMVIWLKEFEDKSYNEIAAAMDCSLGTVMSRLFYARKHLAKLLRDSDVL